jgi:phage repressor protein C with HTH and peptisase S24 domain
MTNEIITINEVLSRLRESLSVDTDYKLAKLLEISQSNISMWRKRGSIPYKMLSTVCSKHELNVNWILNGEGHSQVPGSYDVPAEPGLIPVVGLAEAGPGIFSSDGDYPPGVSDIYLSRPNGLKDISAFGVRIEGDSMFPAFKPGHMVVVSPNMEVQDGDICVLFIKGVGNIIGEVKCLGNGDTLIIKYNADNIKIEKEKIVWSYPVVWHKRK